MKKLWLIVYLGLILSSFFLNFNHGVGFLHIIGGLEAISNFVLVFYFIQSRKSPFFIIDWFLIEALLFSCAGGFLLLLYSNFETLLFINTVGFYLSQFMLINIFRKEGSILPSFLFFFKEWKMIIATIIFLTGVLLVLIPYVPQALLVLSFVYSTQMIVLCWMAYFRPIPQKAYLEGFIGVVLLVLANFWLTVNLLIICIPYVILIFTLLYGVANLLIVNSVARNNNSLQQN